MDPEIEKDGEAGLLDNYKTRENLLEAIEANQDTLNLFQSGWGSYTRNFIVVFTTITSNNTTNMCTVTVSISIPCIQITASIINRERNFRVVIEITI